MDELIIDHSRLNIPETGIYIRAKHDGKWGSYDISYLTKVSLLSWLKSHDGNNPWAEDVVGILMGYGHLHPIGKDGVK